ncbi:hypothetical protein NB476_20850, partial [Vibrio sp. RM-44-3]|nr:hypothetical protein [Vibrio sp. RM-44-3]
KRDANFQITNNSNIVPKSNRTPFNSFTGIYLVDLLLHPVDKQRRKDIRHLPFLVHCLFCLHYWVDYQ